MCVCVKLFFILNLSLLLIFRLQKQNFFYEHLYGSRLTLDHAWILLRHQPKWIQLQQQVLEKRSVKRAKSSTSGYSSSSNPSTPINIEEDETINNAYDPMTRPPGRKAEKRKMKQTTINEPTPVADLIQKMMDEK